jgi:L-iditol 2-dehydrogenase
MKAWVLHGINDIRFEEVPTPERKRNEALVRVKCASICASDLSRVYSSGAYHYPIILGHEFSGIVEECQNMDWIGKRVGIFPLCPCFKCESCKQGHFETCSNYGYVGSRQDGGFAEYIAIPTWNLCQLPDDITFEQAALFEPATVALHAVKMLSKDIVDNIAIVGNGAIGTLVERWLSTFGINARLFGRNRNLKHEHQYSACFEAVGSMDSVRACVDITQPNGQLILVGNPEENFSMSRNVYWKILRKQLTIRGSWNSGRQTDWHDVVRNAQKLRLVELISHRYRFEELNEALELMHGKNAKRCKVVVNL